MSNEEFLETLSPFIKIEHLFWESEYDLRLILSLARRECKQRQESCQHQLKA